RHFFLNDTAPPELYTLSLHDALPIYHGPRRRHPRPRGCLQQRERLAGPGDRPAKGAGNVTDVSELRRQLREAGRYMLDNELAWRSEEHTSELQSRENLVCRLLLEKKK